MTKLQATSSLDQLATALAEDRDAALRDVYRVYRNSYMVWINRVNSDKTLQLDSFQEAVVTLYENVVSGKVKESSTSIKTYLFSIGRNKLLNAIKKERHQSSLSGDAELFSDEKNSVDPELKNRLSNGFDQLGERCRQLLKRFYYDRYSLEAIMHEMDYQSENAVKSYKSRCLSRLRDLVKEAHKK